MEQETIFTNFLTVDEARREGLTLLDSTTLCLVGANGPAGYPLIKAMFKAGQEELSHIWFSTNTSSRRVALFLQDPKATVYVYDRDSFKGLLLSGEIRVLQDHETRSRFWFDGAERYYPLGVDDPDYTILRFDAKQANYYNRLQNVEFEV